MKTLCAATQVKRRALGYNDNIGGRGKEARQAKALAKMNKRHGVVRVDREIEHSEDQR